MSDRPEEAWIVSRARAIVRFRTVVYLAGLLLGAVSATTGSRPVFVLTALVLLLPASAAIVARASRARRMRLTVEGRIAALFAVGFLVAALNTGTNLLYALFALLAAQLAISVIASSAVLRSLFMRRRAPSRVRAREPFPVEVSVRNGKMFSAYALLLEEARPRSLDLERRPATFVPRVGPHETARATYEASFAERGEHTLEGLAVETRFPFGLIARRIELAAPHTVLVTPVVHPVKPAVLEVRAVADAPSRKPLASVETQAATRSLRDYRPGDHPRSIHWRASARRGSLVVKELERSEPRRSLIVLDAWLGARAEGERPLLLEDAVTLAASLVTTLATRGESPGLLVRAPEAVLHAPGRVDAGAALTTLAKLRPSSEATLDELARMGRRAAEGARVIVVTTRPEAQAREALRSLDAPGARFIELARPGELDRYLDVTAVARPVAKVEEARASGAAVSFSRALWLQALFAGTALALASSNPATWNLASTNPLSLGLLLAAGTLAGLVLGAMGKRLSRPLELGLAVAAFLFVPVDLFVLGAELASAFSRALLVLQLAKLLGPRERRDESTILVVALVHVAVAASSTVELSFLPALLGYVACAGYALSVRELRGSPAAPAPAANRVTPGFRVGQAAIGLGTLVLAVLIFVVMPRVGAKLMPMGAQKSPDRLSGFSDTIQLDQSGKIRESQKLAFRAVIVERGSLPAVPLWRGRALDTYDGASWGVSNGRGRIGHQFGNDGGVFVLLQDPHRRGQPPAIPGRASVIDIQLEPMPTVTIFAPGVVHKLEFKTTPPPTINRDALGTLGTFQWHLTESAYRVTCSPGLVLPPYGLKPDDTNRGTVKADVNDTVRRMCLRLPASVDRRRIADYATRVLTKAGLTRSSPPGDIARALEDHFGTSFKYTLDSPHEEGAERVTEFLFSTKQGHCEIFASALAVLLRAIDVPARVVNGYKGGDYHAWSDSYAVRERHAHSWVEALTGEGWTAFDPTPAIDDDAGAGGVTGALEDAREWLEIRWFKDVIAFDTNDQSTALKWARMAVNPELENLDSWKQAGHEMLESGGKRDLGILGGLLAVFLVLGTAGAAIGPRALLAALKALVRRLAGGGEGREASAVARELEALLAALEARGIVRRRGETAHELADRAAAVLGPAAGPVAAVVPFYYEARYGGRDLRADERAAIADAVRAIKSMPRA